MLGDFDLAQSPFPFNFRYFGTFAGPQYLLSDYDYDTASIEGIWHKLIPGDYSFKNLDLGAYLFNSESDYVGFHCDYVATSMMTLEASYGNIPIFNVFANQTNVNGNIRAIGDITAIGNITAYGYFAHNGSFNVTGVGDVAEAINSKKSFDIQHPNKKGYRLRHVCVEGPESAVYIRGKLDSSNVIKLPDYWEGLVDKESISVHLTPIGCHQELFVDSIEWGKNIIIKNNTGSSVKCYYQVWADRVGEKLIPEYQGETPDDYPGNNFEFSVSGWNYDRR